MSGRRAGVAGWLLAAAVVGACDPGPVATVPGEPVFFATVTGETPLEYRGSGTFLAGTDPRRPAAPQTFLLRSFGAGTAAGAEFSFGRAGGDVPEPGTYALGLEATAVRAHFGETVAGVRRTYAAHAGELVITRASPERVEGTFRFEGFQVCEHPTSAWLVCALPRAPLEGARTVQASGSFTASRERGR